MVSHDWHMLGAQYEGAEMHGVSKGLPYGYFADWLGRAAAAGGNASRRCPHLAHGLTIAGGKE
jgi:hypothetical protein